MTRSDERSQVERARRTRTRTAIALVPLAVAAAAITNAAPAAAADPEITAVVPASGPVEGGDVVTVHGSGFIPGHTLVRWDGTELEPAAVSETTVEVIAPPGGPGPVEVRIMVAEGVSTALTYVYGTPSPPTPTTPPTSSTDAATEPSPAASAVPSPAPPRRGRPGERAVPDAVPDAGPPDLLAETGGAPGGLVPGAVLLVLGIALVGGAVRLRS
jgi:hypothetical protein